MILPFVFYAAFCIGASAAESIFSMKIPYPVVGSVYDRAHKRSVLDNRASRHKCVQVGTTLFNGKFTKTYQY